MPRRVDFGLNLPAELGPNDGIRPSVFVRNASDVLDAASQCFDSVWVTDHFMPGDRFRMDCWTQLVWIAARYPGLKLGSIVLANSYRHPPLLAKMAASLQVFSHGRLVLGYGAGWDETEYRAYGYDFPPAATRIAQLAEGIQVMRALWQSRPGRPVTWHGRHYRVTDAYCEPAPEPMPPIMVGGVGEELLLRVVARHADWWNANDRPVPVLRHKLDVLGRHCQDAGRDVGTIRKTLNTSVYLKRTRAAAEALAGRPARGSDPPFVGAPAALRDYLAARIDLGFDLFQIIFPGFPAIEDIRLFGEEVAQAFV